MTEKSHPPLKKFKHEDLIESLFKKEYQICAEDHYQLPAVDSMFTSPHWQISELQILKKELNDVKSKLNDYNFDVWHRHTSQRNKAGGVHEKLQRLIGPEFLTQAWCKFYENVSSFPLVPDLVEKFTSVHLCEAPGAFVTSLNHWLKTNRNGIKWDWIATSLNPYYEGNSQFDIVNDDRFIIRTLDHWYFGVDGTGDITSLANMRGLMEKVRDKGDVLLVTADGSTDCALDPGEQETIVSRLHFCEAVTALNILDTGGSFVLKLFTTFECQTLCLVYLLLCVFEKVYIKKPVTSREGNSETYLVCLGFKGREKFSPYLKKLTEHFNDDSEMAMFRLEDLPESFIEKMISCSSFFKEHQCSVILDNIEAFGTNESLTVAEQIQNLVSVEFVERYRLKRLQNETEKIVLKMQKFALKTTNAPQKKYRSESYNQLCKKKIMQLHERLMHLVSNLESVHLGENSYTLKFTNDLCDLTIEKGKPYKRIVNSYFCNQFMLYKLHEFYEIIDKFDFPICLPTKETVALYKDEMDDAELLVNKIVRFNYMSEQDNLRTFNDIYNSFGEIKEGQCLVLVGYHLLSRFNIGLLFILAHAFGSLEFQLSEALGCIITLRNKKMVSSVEQKLNQIASIMDQEQSEDLTVLSLVPLSFLCEKDFISTIVEVNTWTIKFCVTCSAVLEVAKTHDIKSSN